MNKRTIIIGIGDAGCKIISKVNLEIKRLFIDTDIKVIEKYSGLRIGEKTCKDYSANGSVNLGELSVRESKTKILEEIQNYGNIIVVAAVGGGTSCGASKKIIELALDNNKSVKFITSLPFNFEGSSRLHNAVDCISYIEKLCDVINVGKIHPKERMSIQKLFDIQDELYIKEIEKFCV